MRIRTKKYSTPKSIYKSECYREIFETQWWINVFILSIFGSGIYMNYLSVIITGITLEFVYVLFWLLQVYSIQYHPQGALLFDKLSYVFSPENIFINIDATRGAQINWDQVLKVKYRKDYVLLFLSKIQILYIPYNGFRSTLEKNLFLNLLKKKIV